MSIVKIIVRVRKLLALARSTNHAEAASAAAHAAELMHEYNLSEAELRISGDVRPPEVIIQDHSVNTSLRKIRWKGTIAGAVIRLHGGHMFWRGGSLRFFGRESAVQAAAYTTQFLWQEVESLCAEAWKQAKDDGGASSAKSWCNSFRVGAASAISIRLNQKAAELRRDNHATSVTATTTTTKAGALLLVKKEEEDVRAAYVRFSKGFATSKPFVATTNILGYTKGHEAGTKVHLGGGRAALSTGQNKLPRD